ncbi:MAG TPA: hypothetical protein VKC54_01620 [Patescibacteria group bacterium]|nr:hypothetical protein [Patescibacteria group bacterium]
MFTKPPNFTKLNAGYFLNMMSPAAEEIARPYGLEEHRELKKLLLETENVGDRNFIVVGAGTLWYIDLALNVVNKYISVEPLSDFAIGKQFRFLTKQFENIQIIPKGFNDLNKNDIPVKNSIWAFIFNIIPYINDPIVNLNKVIQKGDIIYFSTWRSTLAAKEVRKKYFDFLNSFGSDTVINPDENNALANFDEFPFSELKYYKSHSRIKNNIIDVLILRT